MSHSTHASPQSNSDAFNELDPHGASAHGQHESHAIVGPFTLRLVLGILLFFTLLTVGQAQAEVWISHALDIELPKWINVSIVLSIATVKALLVMAYFMQLRYDNPLNTIVMLFCFFGFALFLGFTSLDLFNRDTVYDFRSGQIIEGGTGTTVKTANGKPMVEAAKLSFSEYLGVVTSLKDQAAKAEQAGDRAAAEEFRSVESRIRRSAHLGSKALAVKLLDERAVELRKAGNEASSRTLQNAGKAIPDAADPELIKRIAADVMPHGHGGEHAHAKKTLNTPEQTRSVKGRTDALELVAAHPEGEHEDEHAKPAPSRGSPESKPSH
jgi:cytochrome c oxidase subunit 4